MVPAKAKAFGMACKRKSVSGRTGIAACLGIEYIAQVMKPARIKEFVVKRPFTPFRMRMSDGSSHIIQHPELLWVTEQIIGIASGVDDPTGVPARAAFCDPEHVVSIELLQKPRSKAA